MAKMLKSMSEEHAEKLVGYKLWAHLVELWLNVENDPDSTTLFENLARRWDARFVADAQPRDPVATGQSVGLNPPKKDNTGQDFLRRIHSRLDLELVSLMKSEGVNFGELEKYFNARDSGTSSYKTMQLQTISSWGMIGLSVNQDPACVFDLLDAYMVSHFDNMRRESGKAVARINEMRKTPNFIDHMRQWIPYFYMDGLAGRSTLAEHPGHRLVLDLTGLADSGDLDPHEWCNIDQPKFAKACDLLILDVADGYKGNQPSIPYAKMMYTEQMASALTVLPAQLLLMQGVDPRQVMKGIKARIEHMFSQTVEYTGKSVVMDSLCKLPFFQFPELWDDFGITTGDFLGIDLRAEKACPDNSAYAGGPTFYGLGSISQKDKIIEYCETAGIDLADPANIFRLGYGNFLPYSLETVSEETIDELTECYNERRFSFPSYASSDDSGKYLHAYSDRQAAQLFIKAIMSPKIAFRFNGVTPQDKIKEAFIARIQRERPDVVQVAFREVIAGRIPKKYLTKLDAYGKPAFQDLPKLPTRYRDQHFAADLGL